MLKPGTLVRVREYALRSSVWSGVNTDLVRKHGRLWLFLRKENDGVNLCRSLATGREAGWLSSEMETYDGTDA